MDTTSMSERRLNTLLGPGESLRTPIGSTPALALESSDWSLSESRKGHMEGRTAAMQSAWAARGPSQVCRTTQGKVVIIRPTSPPLLYSFLHPTSSSCA